MDNDEAIKWAARIERAVRQRAYDDGYEDGRLDIERELEKRIEELAYALDLAQRTSEARIQSMTNAASSLGDQVDYWRNLVTAETHRLKALLALQVEQADEIRDEAYDEGWAAGKQAEFESAREAREWHDS